VFTEVGKAMTDSSQMPKGVKKITLVEAGEPVVLFDRAKKSKRRGSGFLKPFERALRNSLGAQKAMTENFLENMNESSRKKRNGWAKDLAKNFKKAAKKGMRLLKKKFF
jgi:hypothetical protein